MKIGVICPSEIALRRFMPALENIDGVKFAGVGICMPDEREGNGEREPNAMAAIMACEEEKANKFVETYGGGIYHGYKQIVTSDDIDAIYIPLPPALHYKWAKLALENGKHVLLEKPATMSVADTKNLISVAAEKNLALHENYMFVFHRQLEEIHNIILSGEIGDVRLYRVNFGFPQRTLSDFRYEKSLGGGALYDAGGYTIKYASILLGDSAQVSCAQMNYVDGFNVDIYGSGTIINNKCETVQVAFGMDNSYKCELEVWGSKGCLLTKRILTAPPDFIPKVEICKDNQIAVRNLSSDNSFATSIMKFLNCVKNKDARSANYKELIRQSELVESFYQKAENYGV